MPPPPNNPLSKEQIRMIEQWILQGAKDNTCNEGFDTVDYTYSGTIWPVIQKNCTGCHSSNNPGGGITLTGYDELVALAGNGSLLQKWIDEGFPNLK